MPKVKNVTGSTTNNKPNARRQYMKLTGKPPPKGMQIGHVTIPGQGKRQFLVPVTSKQNHHTNKEIYMVRHKPIPLVNR